MEIREVAVIGLGTMGAGIVEVFARAGLAVTAIEVDRAALARGMAALARGMAALARGMAALDASLSFAPAALLADHATAGLAFHSGGSGQ
jgi:3-hydroxyacyl-CoA dehydrogenase